MKLSKLAEDVTEILEIVPRSWKVIQTVREKFTCRQCEAITSHEFTRVLLAAGISISMDGKGAWRDNVFVERLWRSIKYEEVYLKAYDNVPDARKSISNYIGFYNSGRPHSSLDGRTPDEAYFDARQMAQAA